ncbi:MAG: spore coat U domain-containing protein [Kofleriaceae bacterium]
MLKQALVVGILGMGTFADAGTSTSNMGVTATVVSSCTITAGTVAFPNYDAVTGTQIDGTGTLTVACSKGAITTITLGQGANANTGSTDILPLRQMKNTSTTDLLGYSLYSDSTRLVTWGNTALTGKAYIPASSAPTNVTVYGRITALQDVPAGSYADTVVATISF